MAEEALKKLEEELNCSICLDTYTDPKVLQCFHVYCRQCLVPLVVRDQQGQLGLACPTCRQVTPVPARGTRGLQSAFQVNRLLEIQKSFKSAEEGAVTLEGATSTGVNPVKKVHHCLAHGGKELELYCETCGELVCLKCITKGGKHHDHEYEELDQAFKRYEEEMSLSLETMGEQVTTIMEALAQLDARCGEISDQRAATANNIHGTFGRLREVLNSREIKLIGHLDKITQGKLKGLAAQRDQIETTLAKLSSCVHFVRESLWTGNEGDVLMMKTSTEKQVKELTTPFQPYILEPNAEANIVFTASADMTALCHYYAQVSTPGTPDPSNCQVTGKGAEVAVVGAKSAAVLRTFNFIGGQCEEPIKSLECQLVSEPTGIRASCGVERRGQSHYEISYQPTIKGRHQLHVKIGDQHVRGSPFSITVKSPIQKLGAPIFTTGGIPRPWGVAVTQRGELVVTEWGGHCVSVFSPNGKKIRSFGTRGSGQGQFDHPLGVAVDGEGNILVADADNHRIQKFTLEGQFLAAAGTKGCGHLQFWNPSGIANNHNMVYVADEGNSRVQVLNSDLTFSSEFGKKGSGKGQFSNLRGMACDSVGKVYVADRGNHRIQVFTAEGKFLRIFGRCGQGMGELFGPVGVAVDTSGIVYVSEVDNHRVSVFTSEGEFVTSFGSKGEGPGEFRYPCGLAVDTSGVVYVCDHYKDRVEMF